jgi:hypothetical protein
MIGVPGSAYLGDALAADVDYAAASPDGDSVAFSRGGALYILRNGSSRLLAEKIDGPIAWSPDSSVVAAGGRLFQIASGSSTGLAVLDKSLSAIAASKDHAVAAAPGGVWLLNSDASRLLAAADDPAALAIHNNDLYFADRGRGDIWLLRDYVRGGDPVLVTRIDGAAGVDVAGDRILVTGANRVVALRSGTFDPLFEIELDFTASGLSRLSSSAWLLNAGQHGPLQVLSLDGNPGVYFVPRGGEGN